MSLKELIQLTRKVDKFQGQIFSFKEWGVRYTRVPSTLETLGYSMWKVETAYKKFFEKKFSETKF